LKFQLTQHSRDEQLMRSLVEYLGCGRYESPSRHKFGNYVVTKLSDINEKITPFFDKHALVSVKALDFEDFKRAAQIIKVKGHLTEQGSDSLRKIKEGMNRGR
jgi:hypothetical protein